MRIGMFDSGIGGLTVLKSFLKYHPDNEYFYYGDTLNVPYGSKTKEQLLELSLKIIKYLENKKVDIIIIACGTISSNIYKELQNSTNIPIYSIINETINYVTRKNYKNTLLLATQATVNTHIFKKNISNIIEIACPKLVPLIENKDENIKEVLNDYVKNIKNIDSIILGCTHYPIIKKEIKEIYKDIDLIDMGEVLAKKIQVKDSFKSIDLYFSKKDEKVINYVKMIIGEVC